VVEGISLIVSSQAVIVEGIGRFPTDYLAVTFEELHPYGAGDLLLRAFHISG
jgi:hypothetical protein